jgi:hypothetical protein
MKNAGGLWKALRIGAAFVVVMTLWYLWDRFVGEDSIWKYIVLVFVTALIYAVEIAIAGRSKDS